MNAPAYLEFLGNAPGGNKISGKFPGPEFPDSVTIEGTTDSLPCRGNSGIWMSGNKYNSLSITIVIKKAGRADVTISFDNKGMPVINDAEASAFTATKSGTEVIFTWTITKEISVTSYPIDRKIQGGNYEDADLGVAIDFADLTRPVPKDYPAPGSGNIIYDTPPAGQTYVYRLRARFENQSTPIKVLMESNPVTM